MTADAIRGQGWRTLPLVLLAGCIIAALTFGPRATMGFFLLPMTSEQGWSRETFALAVAIQNLLWGVAQPVAGGFADRYGTGRVLAFGGVLYALALALMAWAPTPLWLHLSAGVLMGIAIAAASFSVVIAAFGRLVPPERRSWAFGLGTAAGSVGQLVFTPLAFVLIDSIGWQGALLFMAALMMLVPILAVVLAGRPSGPAANELPQSFRESLGEAFGHNSYRLLAAGFFVCGFQIAFVTAHLPPYLADKGISPQWGMWAIMMIGFFNIIGSFSAGALGQTYSRRKMLSAIYLARALVVAVFVTLPISPLTVMVFSIFTGLFWLSTVPLTSGLVALMFGTRYLGMLFGFVFFSHQVGSFLGVWLGGKLYDMTGSYDVVWWLGAALGVFAALVHWPIRETAVERLQPAAA